MKKIATVIGILALLLTVLPITALAHGHSRGTSATGAAYTLCPVENCNTVGNHRHDRAIYSGHYIGDGHDYHNLCSVKNCYKTGSHSHNGTICLPHYSSDGHSYHNAGHKGGGHH